MATLPHSCRQQAACDPDHPPVRPGIAQLFREGLELFRRSSPADGATALANMHDGNRRPVMLVPGFLASEKSMAALSRTLENNNYRPFGWGQGVNWGARRASFTRLLGRLQIIHDATGEKVALVGWSIGGVIAREIAKCRPHLVERVITLGSPFSGDAHANRIWRLYELVARHKVDEPPIDCMPSDKPDVPTFALWSRQDGVVATACAQGRPGERDKAIEIDASHMGMVSAHQALAAMLEALSAQRPDLPD